MLTESWFARKTHAKTVSVPAVLKETFRRGEDCANDTCAQARPLTSANVADELRLPSVMFLQFAPLELLQTPLAVARKKIFKSVREIYKEGSGAEDCQAVWSFPSTTFDAVEAEDDAVIVAPADSDWVSPAFGFHCDQAGRGRFNK